MKRSVLILSLAAFVLSSNAQVLKSNLLNGYKQGDKLEKATYNKADAPIKIDTWCEAFSSHQVSIFIGASALLYVADAPIKIDTWCEAFSSQTDKNAGSPITGQELSYEGYTEKGVSIKIGELPENVKGSRFSVYSISEKNDYCRGTLYLSFLANFSSVASSRLGDFIALSPVHTGGNLRARVYVGKIDDEHIRFGTNLLRVNAESFKSHALNKTHLLVLKLDYKKNEVSLFVDPALTAEEPQPDVVAKGDEDNNKLKGGIRSISFRNRDDLTGNVGNFRFSSSWAGVIAQ